MGQWRGGMEMPDSSRSRSLTSSPLTPRAAVDARRIRSRTVMVLQQGQCIPRHSHITLWTYDDSGLAPSWCCDKVNTCQDTLTPRISAVSLWPRHQIKTHTIHEHTHKKIAPSHNHVFSMLHFKSLKGS